MSGPRFTSSCCAGEQFLVWTARNVLREAWRPDLQERLSLLADGGYHIVQERRFGSDDGPVGGIVRAVAHPVREMDGGDGMSLRCWDDAGVSHCCLSGAASADAGLVIAAAQRALGKAGFVMGDVVRTWYRIDGILERYDAFNRQRTDAYGQWGLPALCMANSGRGYPASTGVGGLQRGGHIRLDLYAVKGVAAQALSSPVQKDAPLYGSAFSRGVRIPVSTGLLELSGTAAIDESGASLYPGDFRAQVACTFERISRFLETVGANLSQLAAGCAFIRRPADVDAYVCWMDDQKLDLPLVPVIADICRDDLLFEVDGELFTSA
jgi:enamine deaminase RidA (YjgF/YER057c/UK114 family)